MKNDKNRGIRNMIIINERTGNRTRLSTTATPIFITKKGKKIPINQAIKKLSMKKNNKTQQNLNALKKVASLGFKSIPADEYRRLMK